MKQKEKLLVKLSEVSTDPKVQSAIESAYRRGYQQGFFACMECPKEKIDRLFNKITEWRFIKNDYLPPQEHEVK